MPRITIQPHVALCPEGAVFEAKSGSFLCDALLRQGIALEHACEKSCACSTCHVIIHEGFDALAPASDDEEDQIDKAWGVQSNSRLACQVVLRQHDLVVEMPRHTVNLAREGVDFAPVGACCKPDKDDSAPRRQGGGEPADVAKPLKQREMAAASGRGT